jgi:ureidoacrylate peracid hydrolase
MSSIKESEGYRRGSGHNEASMDLQQPSDSLPQSTIPSSNFLSAMVLPGKSIRNDFPIEWHRAALLIIDIQDLLSSPTSTSATTTTDEEGRRVDETSKKYLFQESLPSAIKNIEMLLSSFRLLRRQKQGEGGGQSGKPEVIFTYLEALTEDYREISLDYKLSGPSLSTMLPTPSKPAIFLPNVSPLTNEIRMPKSSCSVFLSTNINYILKNLNVEQLVLCGQITNQCVESACRDAADLGYFVTVVQDACAAYSLKDHQLGLSNMKGFARIVTTEQVVQELLSSSTSLSVIASASHTFSSMETTNAAVEKKDQQVQTYATTAQIHNIKPLFSESTGIKNVVKDVTAMPIKSILLALRAAQVHFLRYAALDCANGIRCKAVPLQRLISNPETLNSQVCVAEVCFAGMPGFGDMILKDSGLSARNVLVLRPDLSKYVGVSL